MRNIFKYDLMIGYNTLYLPERSKVIHVAEQYGNLTMWVEQPVATHEPNRNYTYVVHGTGQFVNDNNAVHVGTALMSSGLVWHVYEAL